MSINRWIISGNITEDLELKLTKNNNEVLNFVVATKRRIIDQETGNDTEFINVEAWYNNAIFLSKYAKKGQMVLLDGYYRGGQYERDGHKFKTSTFVVESVDLPKVEIKKNKSFDSM